MGKISTVPNWLEEMNSEELEWAASYLSSRTTALELGERTSIMGSDFKAFTRAIQKLELTVDGVKLVVRLRNAVRQKRYRLSDGGKATGSFTLPKKTKTALKRLAKSNGTTETAIIRTLIEEASKTAQCHKEVKRNEALEARITRNSSKLSQELNEVRLKEANRHLGRSLERLARWETYLEGELPELTSDQEAAAIALAEKRMREIQEVIRVSVAKREMMSPRSI